MHSEKRLLRCTRQIATCKQALQVDLQHCGGRRPVLPCVEDSVRRPQRPGNQCACRSTLLEEPSQPFTLENRWEPPALPQCSGRAYRTSRWMSALCARHAFASRENPRAVVQKLWMPAIPCGKRWKNQAKLNFAIQFSRSSPSRDFQSCARKRIDNGTFGAASNCLPGNGSNFVAILYWNLLWSLAD